MIVLIAGAGALPGIVARQVFDSGRSVRVYALDGVPVDLDIDVPVRRFRIERLGSLLAELGRIGAREVCFAGAVSRPAIEMDMIDDATRPLMEQIGAALRAGDDGALRVILGLFERAGLRVLGVQDVAPDLLLGPGVPTVAGPNDRDGVNAARGAAIVAAMGVADLGQSCVIADCQALAVEALPGTNWMLQSLQAGSAPALSATMPAQPALKALLQRGLFYKGPKPDQDRRVDLPTIGRETVERVAALGLRGLVIEAGGVIVLDRDTVIQRCDTDGLFLWARQSAP
ncbi:LpxI family protein [Actibacterium sp. 188UL27-1]|uniref:LpxI family protein n=1 Tax=Actibacterium sp. 188UL27-1 TaxID=2786961 RepID=UPI00195A926B|nr:UDP-2,3-diacylglucosamine diphosphatase LpxI [Actibacterium sp. 188UL27-1]MBM7067707.1 UDP-2,3-diacylglucosamine diphosphatase LpxI [Actibacterium sp. 188UL27-1]